MKSREEFENSKEYKKTQQKVKNKRRKEKIKWYRERKSRIVFDIELFYEKYAKSDSEDKFVCFKTLHVRILARFLSRKGFKIYYWSETAGANYIQVVKGE